MAWLVRATVFLLPIGAGWGAVRLSSGLMWRPAGWLGVAIWAVQALAVATTTATLVDRVTQRALPLATLLGMSMIFPDQAPSRFALALRAGTVRKLRAELVDLNRTGLGQTAQEATERAVELVTLLGQHERLTRGHTERVRAYADMIAVELGLSKEDRQRLAWGALLHDIGKLAVPADILNKAGRPNEMEWAILAQHPQAGARLLRPLEDWLGEWVRAAAEHHERWDGKGYPRGLAGDDISLAGRITAVADAYDVITSRRSYKPPMSVGAARKELVDCAGTQFDPVVVRALLNASVRRRRHAAGLLSWLPELPGLASVSHAVASAPAAVATAVVAVAAPVAVMATEPPEDLAFVPEIATEVTEVEGDEVAAQTPPTTEVERTTMSASSTLPPETEPESTTTTTPSTTTTTRPPTTAPTTRPPTTKPPSTTATTRPPTTEPPSTTATTRPPTTAPTTAATPAPTTTTASPTTVGTTGPTAQDDAASQRQGQQKQYAVLDNDLVGDAPLDIATLAIVAPPSHGTAAIWNSTKVRYTAAAGHVGTDALVYRICDTAGRCSQAALTIELTP